MIRFEGFKDIPTTPQALLGQLWGQQMKMVQSATLFAAQAPQRQMEMLCVMLKLQQGILAGPPSGRAEGPEVLAKAAVAAKPAAARKVAARKGAAKAAAKAAAKPARKATVKPPAKPAVAKSAVLSSTVAARKVPVKRAMPSEGENKTAPVAAKPDVAPVTPDRGVAAPAASLQAPIPEAGTMAAKTPLGEAVAAVQPVEAPVQPPAAEKVAKPGEAPKGEVRRRPRAPARPPAMPETASAKSGE